MKTQRYFSEPQDDSKKVMTFNMTRSKIRRTKKEVSFRQGKKNKNKQKLKKKLEKVPNAYPGKAPIDPKALEKHDRGDGVQVKRVRTKFFKKQQERREKKLELVSEVAARAELLLDDDHGFLEGDETDEFTAQIKQSQIKSVVDEVSASKNFDLNLAQFGPYTLDYTLNGRYLAIGGRKGHVAAFDWISKTLTCEINVQESVHDVKWLHSENLFAVAQKKWTYIYDNQGIEVHCLKTLDSVKFLDFLRYHFLLTSISENGFLSWVDVSIGKLVSQFNTRHGYTSSMCQNPWNAVMCLGHSKGVVTMWTPSMREPVAKVLAHRQGVTAVSVDSSGNYLATASVDRSLKIWDVRQFQCVQNYKISDGASRLNFSGRGLLGVALNDSIEIYKDCCIKATKYPYLRHKVNRSISDLAFVPFEDVMGIGHAGGFTSILVPGAGVANFDALEVNPYQSKSQRKEAEVKALLEKISPDLITLDPNKLGEIDLPSLQEKELEKAKKLHVKSRKIDFEPRSKTKGKSGTAKKFHIKRTVMEEERLRDLNKQLQEAKSVSKKGQKRKIKPTKSLIDRLK